MNRLHTSCEDLLDFALGHTSLSPADRQHLAECPLCQKALSTCQETVASLLPRCYRSQCPSGLALSYYCLPGALTEAERCEIAMHLATCPLCAAELAETLQFLET